MTIDHSKTIEALTLEVDRLRSALVNICNDFNGGEKPKFVNDGEYGTYHSPHSAMVQSKFILAGFEALEGAKK